MQSAMEYSDTLSLECPYCKTRCQFLVIAKSARLCTSDDTRQTAHTCTHCNGIVVTKWDKMFARLITYHPVAGDWKPQVNLSVIGNNEVREDFREAINCYNNGFYNACMIMTRRAIQQEMIDNKSQGNNLYKQIESMGISKNLKGLLHKVKNFGNYGAHPDFFLFTGEGEKIDDKKEIAKLSLEFLDRYFSDQYEVVALIKDAPKSEKELKSEG